MLEEKEFFSFEAKGALRIADVQPPRNLYPVGNVDITFRSGRGEGSRISLNWDFLVKEERSIHAGLICSLKLAIPQIHVSSFYFVK